MLLLFSLLLFPCSPIAGLACTCIQRPEPHSAGEARSALAAVEELFAGQVVHITYRRDSTRVRPVTGDSFWFRSTTWVATLAVEKLWLGLAGYTFQVETAAKTTMCGASLRTGEHYLIDAYHAARSVFITGKCGWTRPLAQAARLQDFVNQALR